MKNTTRSLLALFALLALASGIARASIASLDNATPAAQLSLTDGDEGVPTDGPESWLTDGDEGVPTDGPESWLTDGDEGVPTDGPESW